MRFEGKAFDFSFAIFKSGDVVMTFKVQTCFFFFWFWIELFMVKDVILIRNNIFLEKLLVQGRTASKTK